MSSPSRVTASGPAKRPRSRKSIGYLPSPDEDGASFDQENLGDATTNLDLRPSNSRPEPLSKRSRSKSIGPGGLDALREDAGNRRKAAIIAIPKSILKPSIPLSPLKDIPMRKSGAAPKTVKSSAQSPRKGVISPRKIPAKSQPTEHGGHLNLALDNGKSSATETDQSANGATNGADLGQPTHVDTAEDETKRARTEALKQRDLRRKSMGMFTDHFVSSVLREAANRRVSFAPEATLHTWDMIEELQDSTTSSASTNATRRASAISNGTIVMSPKQQSPRPLSSYTDDPPSTPPSQGEEEVVAESPASQRDLHQKKRRRRSSAVPPMNFNNPDDIFSSPTHSASGSENSGSPTDKEPAISAPHPGHVLDASPVRSAERDDVNESTSSSIDELGSVPMDLADDDVTAAFKPWSQKLFEGKNPIVRLSSTQQQDNTNPFSPAFKNAMNMARPSDSALPIQDDGEMSMDITRAVGFIAPTAKTKPSDSPKSRRSPASRRSVRNRRRSSVESSSMEDASMDLTTAIGVIQPNDVDSMDVSNVDTNEDLSMEFTSVFGGIQSRRSPRRAPQSPSRVIRRRSALQHNVDQIFPHKSVHLLGDVEGEMDLTTAFGAIIPEVFEPQARPDTVDNEDMDMTRAVGTILSTQAQADDQNVGGEVVDSEVISLRSPFRSQTVARPQPATSTSPTRETTTTINDRDRHQFLQPGARSRTATPVKQPHTPSRQSTPITRRPTTPGKTPPFKDVKTDVPSPTKLFQKELKDKTQEEISSVRSHLEVQASSPAPRNLLNPTVRLNRRMSGLGIDREGLGSPRVAMLLDRRASIIENAASFSPSVNGPRGVHFDDPKTLSKEVTREHEVEERNERRQYILEQEADVEDEERDATATLKEAIVSMTPKRKRLGGRKSLAVGAAKGLLGIRPTELDESDEDRAPRGVRSGHSSPVKRIKLSGPSSLADPFDHLNKDRRSLMAFPPNLVPVTPSTSSPTKKAFITTPRSHGRFKNVEALPEAQEPLPTLGHQDVDDAAAVNREEANEKVHLRDFLNLTSIRFIELNTTKRRHTVAPQNDHDTLAGKLGSDSNVISSQKTFEDSVVAGACTVPLLELFQHSCRELKKYIAEGRDVIREIEDETYNDNPALFREYISATPSNRAIMDQQFKNMKTHARLLSKGLWYEWRMKLLEGLKEGLNSNDAGLCGDGDILTEQERIMNTVLPAAVEERDTLEQECATLQARADEMASIDHEELKRAQDELLALEHESNAKRQLTMDYERGFQELDFAIDHARKTKVECLESIREAHKLSEEHRGWSISDVTKLKENVDALETKLGWTITSATPNTLTLVYRHQLQVYFNVSSFLPAVASSIDKPEHSPISLVYIGDADSHHPKSYTTEKRFFLQLMRAHVQSLAQHQTHVKDLLQFVQEGWDKACEVSNEISKLDVEFITNCRILSDERLAATATILLPGLQTKVLASFEVGAVEKGGEIEMGLKVKANVVYGEKYKEDRMGEFLMSRVALGSTEGQGSWVEAVRTLKKKLIDQGRKQ